MPFTSWLRNLPSFYRRGTSTRKNRRAARCRPAKRFRPQLEALELRCMPSFSPVATYAVDASPMAIVTADFNNDGQLDLMTADEGSNCISVLLGNGDGTFQGAVNYTTGTEPLSLAVGDLDGDLDLDIATANRFDVSVLLGSGNGTFQPASSFDIGYFPTALAVGHFNDDGLLDLGLTSNSDYDSDNGYWGFSYANVLLGDGAGGFSGPNITNLADGYYPSAAVADFNADGIDDLATANAIGGTVSVLLGDLSGYLQGPTDFYTGYSSHGVTADDLDGDDDSDLVAANFDGNVSVLLGDGAGGFGAAQNYAAGAGSGRAALADFNNDTYLDIATANYSGGSASVLLGRGDGTFSPPLNSAAGTKTWAVAAGDFNGDGWFDAATANYSGNNVSVLINDHSWPSPNSVSVSINDMMVTEGNTSSTTATFTVTLSAASNQDVTVHYQTATLTAIAGNDYQALTGTLTFAPGETSKTISVSVIGDRVGEPNETFLVTLSNPTNATIADGTGQGTITDDEPRISISDFSKAEGNNGQTKFTFTVTLSAAYDVPLTLNFATSDGSAKTSDNDYVADSGAITFAPGQTTKTIAVVVKGDKKREASENFFVDLSDLSSYAVFLDSRGMGTILNDD